MVNVKSPTIFSTVRPSMTERRSIELMLRLKGYVKLNWGSPFVFSFVVLLLSAGYSLLCGISSLADILSECAFYALAIGVTLQILCSLKYRESKSNGTV